MPNLGRWPTVKRSLSMVLALVIACLWVSPVLGQCDKDVNDNGVIRQALEAHFETSRVGGESGAPVDWCYFWRFDELFLFLMKPLDSRAQAEAMMKDIGLAILASSRLHRRQGQDLSPFEKRALGRGFTILLSVQGKPRSGFPVKVYVSPSSLP